MVKITVDESQEVACRLENHEVRNDAALIIKPATGEEALSYARNQLHLCLRLPTVCTVPTSTVPPNSSFGDRFKNGSCRYAKLVIPPMRSPLSQ